MYVIAQNGKILQNTHHAKDFKKCSTTQKKKMTETVEPPIPPQPIKKKSGRPKKRQQPSASIKEQADDKIIGTQDTRAPATEEEIQSSATPTTARSRDQNSGTKERVQ